MSEEKKWFVMKVEFVPYSGITRQYLVAGPLSKSEATWESHRRLHNRLGSEVGYMLVELVDGPLEGR